MKSWSKRLGRYAAGAALVAVVGMTGYLSREQGVPGAEGSTGQRLRLGSSTYADDKHAGARVRVSCRQVVGSHPFVIAAFGQSNSANFGETRHAPQGAVYELLDGRCYRARDPLLGGDGKGGSIWTRLAERLIAHKYARSVVLISFGVSATEIARWAPGGDLNVRIEHHLGGLGRLGLDPNVVLFVQGETDAKIGTGTTTYLRQLNAVVQSVRRTGVEAPFVIAVASYCHGRVSPDVTAAQRSAVDHARRIYEGPDMDQLRGVHMRFDDCHFSAQGMERAAELWMNVLSRLNNQ